MSRHFGGWGGITETIPLEEYDGDEFAKALDRAVGERMRSDKDFCKTVWGALANVTWRHENGDWADYSFRAGGDLIAAIRREGHYMDWYCSGPYAVVSDEIATAMKKEGWTPTDEEEPG